jgi:leukotriene-A4 hydrolase
MGHVDMCSRSNAEDVQIRHLDWTVLVDFDTQTLHATARYFLSNETNSCQLLLDTNHLAIQSVFIAESNNNNDAAITPLEYTLLPEIPNKRHLGRALVISLPKGVTEVTVQYETTEKCSALQWLPPAQTAGKMYPYLYSQCQAIHARSLVPCQDVTRVKFTYTATVTTPLWATAVLSGVLVDRVVSKAASNAVTSVWKQTIPISSYLLALAVGQLEKRDLSERCAVYSEPSVVDAAAYEFAETEIFLKTAEDIAGTPYQWGRYDLLCLPPSVCVVRQCFDLV